MKKKPTKPKTPKADTQKKAKKKKYKVRNWKEYNAMLVNRGRLMVHITTEAIEEWEKTQKTGKRGKPRSFSDTAIEVSLTIQQCFRLPLRNTEGVVAGLLDALGASCKAPDYSTLSKRGKTLSINIRIRPLGKGPLHLVVDSSGVKLYGEGEWKTRQHGISKRRTWKKIHLGWDAETRDVIVADVTDNDVHDSEVFPGLLGQIPEETNIDQVSNDGAYDTSSCYDAIAKRGARAIIPPRKDAKIRVHGNTRGTPHPRDVNLRRIRKIGRKQWKIESGYHRRSLAENGFFRLKTIFGDRISARTKENQRTQLLLRVKILNRFTALGMPDSYAVT
jgi:hypothetical protein